MNFSSLWVGGPMTLVQTTSLASFIYHGHTITLYTDDMTRAVPDGVLKADVSDIVSLNNQFILAKDYFAFSDVFRYNLLKKKSTIWVDSDTLCLKENLDVFEKEYVFSKENKVNSFVPGVLKAPSDSEFVDYLSKESLKPVPENYGWGVVGPKLFDSAVRLFGLEEEYVDESLLLMIQTHEWLYFWEQHKTAEILRRSEASYMASLYNGLLTPDTKLSPKIIDRNCLPPGSAMEYFYNKFVL